MDLLRVGRARRVRPPRRWRVTGLDERRGARRLPRGRARAAPGHALPARAAAARDSRPLTCAGSRGIVRADAGSAGRARPRCGAWRAPLRHRGPGRLRAGARATASASSRPGWRSSTSTDGWQPMRPASARCIAYNGEVYNHVELRASSALGDRAPRAPTPRSCCGCSSARARPRCTAATGSSRSPGGSPAERRLTLVRDRFGVRPLLLRARRATASLVFGSEAQALFASGEVAPAPDLGGLDEVFTPVGRAAAPHGLRRRARSSSRAACSSGSTAGS